MLVKSNVQYKVNNMISKWFLILYVSINGGTLTLIKEPLSYYKTKEDCEKAAVFAVIDIKRQLKVDQVETICLSNDENTV